MHVHVEVQPDAEVAGHERRERRVVPGVRQHAVDVGRFEAGIVESIVDRPGRQVAGGLLGAPRGRSSRPPRRWRSGCGGGRRSSRRRRRSRSMPTRSAPPGRSPTVGSPVLPDRARMRRSRVTPRTAVARLGPRAGRPPTTPAGRASSWRPRPVPSASTRPAVGVEGAVEPWKLTVSRTVMAWSSANTCRSCSTARSPPADAAVGHERHRLGPPLAVGEVDRLLERRRVAVVVLRRHDHEGVGRVDPRDVGVTAGRRPLRVARRAGRRRRGRSRRRRCRGGPWPARRTSGPTTGPKRPSRVLPMMTATSQWWRSRGVHARATVDVEVHLKSSSPVATSRRWTTTC